MQQSIIYTYVLQINTDISIAENEISYTTKISKV